MKLFLKEHRLLIVVQCLQFAFIWSVLLLSNFKDYVLMFYGVFVSFVFLICYLAYQYYSRRHVYKKLSKRPEHLDELIELTDHVPLGVALDQLMKKQYQLYMRSEEHTSELQSRGHLVCRL